MRGRRTGRVGLLFIGTSRAGGESAPGRDPGRIEFGRILNGRAPCNLRYWILPEKAVSFTFPTPQDAGVSFGDEGEDAHHCLSADPQTLFEVQDLCARVDGVVLFGSVQYIHCRIGVIRGIAFVRIVGGQLVGAVVGRHVATQKGGDDENDAEKAEALKRFGGHCTPPDMVKAKMVVVIV